MFRTGAFLRRPRLVQRAVAKSCYIGVCGKTSKADALPVVYHPAYSAPQLPSGHRFPMGVFRQIYKVLMEDGYIKPQQVHVPPSLPTRGDLSLVHDLQYLDDFCGGRLSPAAVKRIGFGDITASPALIERTLAEVAGTLLTAELALRHGLACNTAGGTHHAFPAFGSGFCILNDLAVAAEVLLARGTVERVLILDLDVHQGDGTAFAFAGRPDVFTLSMHAARNFPARKQASHLDIPLPDGTGDEAYLSTLGIALPRVLATFSPQLILYDAGVDPHIHDALGRLALTDAGLSRRESLVFDACLAKNVPVAGVVGGGYDADLDALARRHALLHRAAIQAWRDYGLSGA